MSDKDGKVQFYSNQPYDMEMKLDGSEDSASKDDSEGKMEKVNNQKYEQEDDYADPQAYQEARLAQAVKPLPKFDISQFQSLQTTPELKDLFATMQR
jgi:hypothetical protein